MPTECIAEQFDLERRNGCACRSRSACALIALELLLLFLARAQNDWLAHIIGVWPDIIGDLVTSAGVHGATPSAAQTAHLLPRRSSLIALSGLKRIADAACGEAQPAGRAATKAGKKGQNTQTIMRRRDHVQGEISCPRPVGGVGRLDAGCSRCRAADDARRSRQKPEDRRGQGISFRDLVRRLHGVIGAACCEIGRDKWRLGPIKQSGRDAIVLGHSK